MSHIETIKIIEKNEKNQITKNLKEIAVLIRPMHLNDVKTIFEVQKEMFPTDDLYEEYEAFKSKFTVYPQGCWCVDLILENENKDDINFFENYEPSNDLELNKKKLLAHFFSHPWFKDQFPPINNPKAVKEGVSKIIDSKTGEIIDGCGDIMLYLNEIAVRPMGRGFNLARILTNRILHHLYQQNSLFDHMGLVSVQGSYKVWGSIGFEIDTNLTEEKKNYLIKCYGNGAYYMKMKYTLSNNYLNNYVEQHQQKIIYLNNQNNQEISTDSKKNNIINYGKLFKEIKVVSKL